MTEQDIVENLRTRAAIRRSIPRAKDGKPDRIADLCEEAANEIERLRAKVARLQADVIRNNYQG
jgi:hypothetical protein